MRRHAAARGQDALRRVHAAHVLGRRLQPHQDDLPGVGWGGVGGQLMVRVGAPGLGRLGGDCCSCPSGLCTTAAVPHVVRSLPSPAPGPRPPAPTFSPSLSHFSASSAVKTTLPTAAPGEAGRPLPSTAFLYSGLATPARRTRGGTVEERARLVRTHMRPGWGQQECAQLRALAGSPRASQPNFECKAPPPRLTLEHGVQQLVQVAGLHHEHGLLPGHHPLLLHGHGHLGAATQQRGAGSWRDNNRQRWQAARQAGRPGPMLNARSQIPPLPAQARSPPTPHPSAPGRTCSAAGPVRLPLRVCSMNRMPSCTVNSQSCRGNTGGSAQGAGKGSSRLHATAQQWPSSAQRRAQKGAGSGGREAPPPLTRLHVAHVPLQQGGVGHQVGIGGREVVGHLQGGGVGGGGCAHAVCARSVFAEGRPGRRKGPGAALRRKKAYLPGRPSRLGTSPPQQPSRPASPSAAHVRHVQRRADARHHVLALRVGQVLAVQHLVAGGRVAREAHACACRGGRQAGQAGGQQPGRGRGHKGMSSNGGGALRQPSCRPDALGAAQPSRRVLGRPRARRRARTGARVVVEVAVHHGLHVDGGAQQAADAVDLPAGRQGRHVGRLDTLPGEAERGGLALSSCRVCTTLEASSCRRCTRPHLYLTARGVFQEPNTALMASFICRAGAGGRSGHAGRLVRLGRGDKERDKDLAATHVLRPARRSWRCSQSARGSHPAALPGPPPLSLLACSYGSLGRLWPARSYTALKRRTTSLRSSPVSSTSSLRPRASCRGGAAGEAGPANGETWGPLTPQQQHTAGCPAWLWRWASGECQQMRRA